MVSIVAVDAHRSGLYWITGIRYAPAALASEVPKLPVNVIV